jgi:tRNA-2-methylthio-N6-dimethylallyladenosine synthase
MEEAELILISTCAIRENAEVRVRGRLDIFRLMKKKNKSLLVGVIGCMAERLKEKLLEQEKMIDLVVGPDNYRDLPLLVQQAGTGQKAINVLLSREETYADISPVRIGENKTTAFVSITRGCNNMCAYCVVPYTRGGERSRDPDTIVEEVTQLIEMGYKEVTLLGQNVDSYNWSGKTDGIDIKFHALLERVAQLNSSMRVSFSTSHPKDITDDLLLTIARNPNICKTIHLPVQSGSNKMLEMMKRGYTREWYMDRVASINRIIPGCAITTDIIAGFCSETEEDHQETLSLLNEVKYNLAFTFKYSERPNTYAQRKYSDDVPEPVKSRRLQEIIDLQRKISLQRNKEEVGNLVEVLVDGTSKKSTDFLMGRTFKNQLVVFPKTNHQPGQVVNVRIERCTSATLIGNVLE